MSKFVWFDYVSPDALRAQAFFQALFGWSTVEASQGGYTMLAGTAGPMGGYARGATAHWRPFLQTWDLAAAIATVTARGGAVIVAPFVVGAMGDQAIVTDPLAGEFALWQPAKRAYDGIDFRGVDGTWAWAELYTQDPDASLAFYEALGGFTHRTRSAPVGMPGPARYEILESAGASRAGIMKLPGLPQMWMPYVQVADVDATVARAASLGATFRTPPETMPGVGRMTVMVDALGAPLGLLAPERQ
ncbi:MAG TPA: VOC family protein [Kofleriaceae bacterium]|nr:VOC family protein [Kofleriaceae bacterium]